MSFKTIFLLLALSLNFGFLQAQDFSFTSDLPLVFISTGEKDIPDSPKINAEMGVIWNGIGKQNSTNELFNHYNGKISIEIRGSSSQMFPKKSYSFETKDSLNADMDFPLLGLPEEEDWILYAPYTDKTMVRNVLTFTLAQSLGSYTPGCRFVELFLNNTYQGIYVLMEKIKRDKNRVDIAKLKLEDNAGEELTGGYIVKIDKTSGSGGSGWKSKYLSGSTSNFYQYEYPDYVDITADQKQYIKGYFDEFETSLFEKKYDSITGYRSYINTPTFIDYLIMNEISKNVDGYRLSAYFYKDKNEKLNVGPLWDFNLAYGNANYTNAWDYFGLQVYADLGSNQWTNPFWWKGLLADRSFANELKCRWTSLRENNLSTSRIINVVDSLVNLLRKPAERNFQTWPVIGLWVWPNYYVGESYSAEVEWMKNWIYERMQWLDLSIPGECGGKIPELVEAFELKVFPNPFSSKLVVKISSNDNLTIHFNLVSINGNLVFSKDIYAHEGIEELEIETGVLASGVYFYRIFKGDNEFQVGKLVKL
jgi:hypothetical protein